MSQNNNPIAYKNSAEFLLEYPWKGKTKEQIIAEMKFPDYEQKYLDDAIRELTPKGKFSGMDLDAYFVLRMAMDEEDVVSLDDEDILYLN